MKIFVSYPDGIKPEEKKTFSKAIDYLKKQGHNVKEDLEFKKSSKTDAFHSKVDKAIKDADIVIVDISSADTKVGFDIARALDEKKVVIGLEAEDSNNSISSIHGNSSKNLVLKKYNEKNIVEATASAVEEAKGKLDTKFILIISPEIDRYLDWSASTKRMHKAQVVRNAIESIIKKDKEYKAYLD